jgi:hypothetical protein
LSPKKYIIIQRPFTSPPSIRRAMLFLRLLSADAGHEHFVATSTISASAISARSDRRHPGIDVHGWSLPCSPGSPDPIWMIESGQ